MSDLKFNKFVKMCRIDLLKFSIDLILHHTTPVLTGIIGNILITMYNLHFEQDLERMLFQMKRHHQKYTSHIQNCRLQILFAVENCAVCQTVRPKPSLFLSSPEHKVLRVSYCDRPMSGVRRPLTISLNILFS